MLYLLVANKSLAPGLGRASQEDLMSGSLTPDGKLPRAWTMTGLVNCKCSLPLALRTQAEGYLSYGRRQAIFLVRENLSEQTYFAEELFARPFDSPDPVSALQVVLVCESVRSGNVGDKEGVEIYATGASLCLLCHDEKLQAAGDSWTAFYDLLDEKLSGGVLPWEALPRKLSEVGSFLALSGLVLPGAAQ